MKSRQNPLALVTFVLYATTLLSPTFTLAQMPESTQVHTLLKMNIGPGSASV